MGKMIPILLLLIGIGGGIGAGLAFRPEHDARTEAANPPGECPELPDLHASEDGDHAVDATVEYVKLNNQFVVPVVNKGKVSSLVVMSLSVEVSAGRREDVFSREPLLRDAFLQVLFDHANMGGFAGAFTNANNMDVLRNALFETARKVAGDLVLNVLIVDIARQDV